MKQTRLAIIGTVGVPAITVDSKPLTEHLIQHLSKQYDIAVYCSGKKYPAAERKRTYKGARLIYLPLDANGVQSIPYDTLSILHALLFSDVLLILGVAGAWVLPFVRWFTKKKIIVSIDGIEWKRDKWGVLAKWYLFWAEKIAVKYSHIDISDNEAIQDYTAERYGSLSRVIEYGADHTLRVPVTHQATLQYPFIKHKYAFKVCRIEPENNVHLILEAFSITRKLPLVIVGNWDKSAYGRMLRNTYANVSNIYMLDPIYDQEQLDLIRSNASIYVHGHSAGGTNPSLVEAMYLGLPILAFGVSYNRVTTEGKAIYFQDLQSLVGEINNIRYDSLINMGKEMERIARRRYTLSCISSKYALLVEEVLVTERKSSIASETKRIPYAMLMDKGYAHLKTSLNF